MDEFVIQNGVLLSYHGPGGDVVIPHGVTALEAGAFESCTNITSITIPASITSVGKGVFVGCKSLRMIVAPGTTIRFWREQGRMLSAFRGYLAKPEWYQAPEIVAEYEAWIAERMKLLPMVFQRDAVRGLIPFANCGKITEENFETDFFQPALQANATECVAFLLGWKNRHIRQNQIDDRFVL